MRDRTLEVTDQETMIESGDWVSETRNWESGNWKLGVKTLGPETRLTSDKKMGWIPRASSTGGSSSHEGGRVAHQVALRGDTNEDEVIPNSNLFSFRPLLGGWVHRPPTGFSYGGKILRMMAAQNSLPKVFPVLSLPSLLPQILLLLPPTLCLSSPFLPSDPLPTIPPCLPKSPHPNLSICTQRLSALKSSLLPLEHFHVYPYNSVGLHPNFLPVLSLSHPAPSCSSTCCILLQSHVEGQLVGHGAGSSEAAQILGS